MSQVTTVDFPTPFEPVKRGQHWYLDAGREVKLSNLTKVMFPDRGYTKGDVLAYYHNIADTILPYLHDRPLTLWRMPDGVGGGSFFEKQAPAHTPEWVPRAYVEGHAKDKAIDFLLAQDRASLYYVANLGCIEMHPLHARQTSAQGHPDYAFFDLDPFPPITFADVKQVAKLVNVSLERFGLKGYPKIGATGIVVYVPLDGSHTYEEARAFVERVCRIIHKAYPDRTTMEWEIKRRSGKVFLDFGMVREAANIAGPYSLRATQEAIVSAPLRWDELDTDVEPADITISTIWARLEQVGDVFEPMKAAGTPGGYDLTAAMEELGIDVGRMRATAQPAEPPPEPLVEYKRKRSFDVTSEPEGDVASSAGGDTFMIHKHHARRLHYDLRLERGGVLVSFAVPRGLPEVPNERRLAVHVEDHPFEYGSFEGTIPKGEYGAGEARIYDRGTYDVLEWTDRKITIRLHGARVEGEYHLIQTDGKNWLVFRSAREAPMAPPLAPPGIEPMLATPGGEAFDDPSWVFEPKWDGVRTLAYVQGDSLKLVSRRRRDVTSLYPELARMPEMLSGRNGLVDGEIVAFDEKGRPSFERIQGRFTQARPSEALVKSNPVEFLAFDLLWLDGESLMDRPLEERRAALDRHVVPGNHVQHSPQIPERGTALFAQAAARGLEGVVAKRLGSVYRPGQRTKDWVKIKATKQQDVVIVGWVPAQGERSGAIGSLVAAVHDAGALRYAGHIGTGFTARTLKTLAERLAPLETDTPPIEPPAKDDVDPRAVHWVRPELVATAEYLEFTSAGRMRAASFKGLRDDKAPEDCMVGEA